MRFLQVDLTTVVSGSFFILQVSYRRGVLSVRSGAYRTFFPIDWPSGSLNEILLAICGALVRFQTVSTLPY